MVIFTFLIWDNYRIRKIASNGIITTVAGSGTSGYSGDYGYASQSVISRPTLLRAVDDEVYFIDSNNKVLRRIAIECPRYSEVNPNNSSDCTCLPGYYGELCEDFDCFGINQGNDSSCSSNGICIEHDTCQCADGYYGDECDEKICYGVLSHDQNVCSGHGECVDTDTCLCQNGYEGEMCLPLCFGIESTNSSVCLGNGQCVEMNTCACQNGYLGAQCDSYGCFDIESTNSSVCFGNG